jgi:hypothetical protein
MYGAVTLQPNVVTGQSDYEFDYLTFYTNGLVYRGGLPGAGPGASIPQKHPRPRLVVTRFPTARCESRGRWESHRCSCAMVIDSGRCGYVSLT